MYNHYIPQSDGSFRRNTVPDSSQGRHSKPYSSQYKPEQAEQTEKKELPEQRPLPCETPTHGQERTSITSFLKNLLPSQIDIYDLIVIGLLLLINQEENDTDMAPLLTIALYFLL